VIAKSYGESVWLKPGEPERRKIMPKKSKTKTANHRLKVRSLATKKKTLTAKEARNVKGGLAVDPSDPSGNTVYISGASGGVWKITNAKTLSK